MRPVLAVLAISISLLCGGCSALPHKQPLCRDCATCLPCHGTGKITIALPADQAKSNPVLPGFDLEKQPGYQAIMKSLEILSKATAAIAVILMAEDGSLQATNSLPEKDYVFVKVMCPSCKGRGFIQQQPSLPEPLIYKKQTPQFYPLPQADPEF